MKLLRDKQFQVCSWATRALKEPSSRRTSNRTTCRRLYMVRDIAGAEYKPEDYLRAFERFVREHKTQSRCDPHPA